MFRKVLIANRGEIAVRVIRACHELGIEAVAIYSEPDRTSLHVQMADEAYLVGPAPSVESYLKQDRVISVANKTGAEAIHPGYGFLAENGEFARKVEEAGLKFVGPGAESIKMMGDKTQARALAKRLKVPTIPGTVRPISDHEEALKTAQDIGYPILLKAAAGGGGKGIRLVRDDSEFGSAFRASQNEARSAFGDDRIYIEKYIQKPRHIEFQILADRQGNTVHLLERECSIQRRHQKLVEESPAVPVTPKIRKTMGEAAVRLAKAAKYENAGTIEFLMDGNGNFYFLEMNTRLQVEHPVTEAITGIDLVKEQLRIAAGASLQVKQGDIQPKGHAIECRICAEDAGAGFMPSTGKIEYLFEPNGNGVRCDSGIYAGVQVYPYYDPLLAKLIVWAATRDEAIDRMRRALNEYQVYGIETCIPFHIRVMDNERFRAGEITTHFIEQEKIMTSDGEDEALNFACAVSSTLHHTAENKRSALTNGVANRSSRDNWKMSGRMEVLNKQ